MVTPKAGISGRAAEADKCGAQSEAVSKHLTDLDKEAPGWGVTLATLSEELKS